MIQCVRARGRTSDAETRRGGENTLSSRAVWWAKRSHQDGTATVAVLHEIAASLSIPPTAGLRVLAMTALSFGFWMLDFGFEP